MLGEYPLGKLDFSFLPSPTDTRNTGADYEAIVRHCLYQNVNISLRINISAQHKTRNKPMTRIKNEVLLNALTFRRITQHHRSGDIITFYSE